MQLYEYTLRGWVHPADVFVGLFASDKTAFWLDREFHPQVRKTVMGHAFAGTVVDFNRVVGALQNIDHELKGEHFTPGYVGWLEYPNSPSLHYSEAKGSFLEVREALVFDHDKRQIHLVGNFENEAAFRDWTSAILLRLSIMGGQKEGYLLRAGEAVTHSAVVRHRREKYLELIAKVQQHISAGDVYQLCLTNQIVFKGKFDPLATFIRLRTANPAPYASFMRINGQTMVSSSPEQFFSVRDSIATTKPIKGTRARVSDQELDSKVALELQNNAKERAENLMIVDLMRNDFSKFCYESTVKVEKLFDVESYATVHQLVSTVTGQLQQSVSAAQALLSAFPGGSMTGAPKFRAQELIRELEQFERGIYSGVSGLISLDGSLDMAMNIRCLIFENDQVSLGVGGGITADSNPEAEFEEIQLKAKALLNALNASVNW